MGLFFAVLLVFTLSGCTAEDKLIGDAKGELVYKKCDDADFYKEEYIDYKVSYIDYDDFFLGKGEKQIKEGRYADTTPDGKVNWKESYDDKITNNGLVQNEVVFEMLKKVTFNGRNVTLPCRFKDLDDEFAIFDNIDFSMLNRDMYPFTITDKKTRNDVFAISKTGGLFNIAGIFHLRNSFGSYYCNVITEEDSDRVIGIDSGTIKFLPLIDISVDGIGIGDTFNDVYEKFGRPNRIIGNDGTEVIVSYNYFFDNDSGYCGITFAFREKVYDYRKLSLSEVRNNIITRVAITYLKEAD